MMKGLVFGRQRAWYLEDGKRRYSRLVWLWPALFWGYGLVLTRVGRYWALTLHLGESDRGVCRVEFGAR